MCCFSRPVEHVADTSIFVRRDGTRQAVVYAMRFSAREDLAMVLPLPTPPQSPEDAVGFVSLEGYRDFFADMDRGFPSMMPASRGASSPGRSRKPNLVVHEVGAFDASFVPSQDDFERLDERFRISKDVWSAVPIYADYGFAVFKLRKAKRQRVHPMAFWFPTRESDRLFFPTVHIHDGAWTETAGFDHALYCQVPEDATAFDDPKSHWTPSNGPARHFMTVRDTQGLVERALHVYRRTMVGAHPNEDVYA